MASSSPYSHSTPASSSSQSCNYDVFLSFRGEDTRKTFVDHLYSALVDRNISTYKDDETLPRGESIRPALYNAIKGSQIAVIIFSKNYADSSWCLEELTYIMKCKDTRGLVVMPVFYDVVPSEVRKQQGDFGRGFVKHEAGNNINKVESWRKALKDASEIAGWEPKNIANGHESKVIKEIVSTISDMLFSANLCLNEDLVGMSTRLQELEAQLDIGSHGVHMVGVWGLGGSGKTTLASSLYMKISCHFQSHCLLDNVREESSKQGLKAFQEKLLSRLLKTEMKVQSVEEGKQMIRSRLNHSKVLILLDDVDDCKQLEALAGSHNWFGAGSRILITTRYEHLLRTHKVDRVCPVVLLSPEEAVMLFNKHAYNKDNRVNDYETLSLHVVSYADGLPLALKVLGSFLYDKEEKEWKSSLARLKDNPEMEIMEKLIISYDGLKTVEKELFLDIACFFRWSLTNDAMEVFEACGYHSDIGIKVLTQKALITIVNGRFDMHDLVQDMGHYIVRRDHPNDPTKHSRVWIDEEIENMCLSDATTENDKIEAIHCSLHANNVSAAFYKNVSNMKKLRYLRVYSTDDAHKIAKGPNFLSNELRHMKWNKYPTSPFPDTFKGVKLAILKLDKSLQEKLWKGYKRLPQLKVLQLEIMDNLISTSDFDGLPSLQNLTLHYCGRLEKIHPSLGKHTNLKHVSVKYCFKLRTFPTIIQMRKLKTLEIESWHESLEFPEIKSNMESLVKLSLRGIGIDVLLSCIGERCANLISLCLSWCFYSMSTEGNFDGLKHLEQLELYALNYRKMQDHIFTSSLIGTYQNRVPQLSWNLQKLQLKLCSLKDGEIPFSIGEMSNLEELDLSQNHFTRLDFTISQLTRLKLLDVSRTLLVELPKLPSSLIVLHANRCQSLTTIGDCYVNCKCLCDVSLDGWNDVIKLLEFMLQGKAVENHNMILELQGMEIAKGLIPPLLISGSTCRYRLLLPENWRNDFSGFLICIVAASYIFRIRSLSIEHVMSGMECENGTVWEESESASEAYKTIRYWYVSFGALRDTTWWNSIYKGHSISFHLSLYEYPKKTCWGFGVRMVGRKNRSGATETSMTHEESEFSLYTPKVEIQQDSQYALELSQERYHDYL